MSVQENAAKRIQNEWKQYVDSKDSCAICMNIIGKECATTKCGHKFCTECLLKAVQRNGSCPLCRNELINVQPTPDHIEEQIQNSYWDGWDAGREESEEEIRDQLREEIDISSQQAYDEGIVYGKQIAQEDFSKMLEESNKELEMYKSLYMSTFKDFKKISTENVHKNFSILKEPIFINKK